MTDPLQNLKAIGLVILGFGMFAVNDSIIKYLAQHFTISQTLFWTSLFVGVILLAYIFINKGPAAFKTTLWSWHLVRGLCITGLVFCNIYALTQIKLTDFYAIVFTTPLSMALIARVALKDELTLPQFMAICAGFLVVLYMCRPGSELFDIGAVFAAFGTLFLVTASLLVRSKLKDEDPLLLGVTGPATLGVIALAVAIGYAVYLPQEKPFVLPEGIDWGIFLLSGLSSAIANVVFIAGFQKASSAAVAAPFHYTQMIWGAVLGYLIFEEIPSTNVVIGSIALAVLGTYLIMSESRNRKQKMLKTQNENLQIHEFT